MYFNSRDSAEELIPSAAKKLKPIERIKQRYEQVDAEDVDIESVALCKIQ